MENVTPKPCILCGISHPARTMGYAYNHNPIVNAAIQLHLRGACSYEEALILAITHLVRNNEIVAQELCHYRTREVKEDGSNAD